LTNPGSYDWLRAMAACNSRCGDDDDAMGLVAAADTIHQLERENAALREVLVDIARPRPNHTAEHMQLKAQAAIDAIRAINALRAKEGGAT
jgi:hypothetical protein